MKYSFHEPTAYCRWRKCLLIMRLTLILLVAFVLHAGARGTAQTVTLSVSNMPLEKVCQEIEKQTGYSFVYAKDIKQNGQTVSINIDHLQIQDALQKIFVGLPFTYQVIDRVVVINTAVKPEKFSPPSDQTIRVEGIVLSEQGRPLSETSVTIKATGKGTFTNVRGEFMLPAIPANTELIISHIGYSTRTIVPKEGKFLEVKMELAANLLDAQVVKGYYATSNRFNTGNSTTVKGEDIAKQPVTDPILALEGRVAGLSIAQVSGVPGAYSVIRLRGQNTIPDGKPMTANDPLYIVDGIPFSSQSLTSEFIGGGIFQSPTQNNGPSGSYGAGQGMSPFNNLNPADIESVEVLKDADATAIYGSRGANGVILITTKKGKTGRNKLDVNLYSGASMVTRRMHLLSTPQYLLMRREALYNDGIFLSSQDPANYSDLLIWDTTRHTDWQKVLMGNSNHFTNAQMSFSGGSVNTQFMISGGYSRQGTLLPGDYADQKASLHMAVTAASPNQRLHTQLSVSYVNDNSNMPDLDPTQNITLAPDAPTLFDKNGDLNWQPYGGTNTWRNPLAYTANHAKAISEFSSGNFVLDYNLAKGLNIKCNAGYSQQRMDQIILTPSTSSPPPSDNDPNHRGSLYSLSKSQSWIIEPQLNYNKTIAKGILEFLVGSTFQENTRDSRAVIANGFSSNALLTNIMAASYQSFAGNVNALYHYNALFGRIGYNWDGKYIVNLTGRRDGSSRFGPNKQFGNFGAIGVAWIFSKEKWIQEHLSFLSFGKLRGSYGVTGNDQIGDYAFLSTYTPTGSAYQGVSGLRPTLMPNPYFQWERVRKLEGGLEFGLLRDAILLTASYYRNRTDNQLVGYPIPLLTGFGSVQANLPALIQNKGWEFTAHTKNLINKNFTWTSDFNLAISRNKLVNYPGIETSSYAYTYRVGQPLSSQLLYQYKGVDPQTGIYKFESKKGNGVPATPQDRYPTKPITQSYFGGIGNGLRYKQFQLDVWIQFVRQLGYNYSNSLTNPGSQQNQPTAVLGRWQKAGDKANVQQFSDSKALSPFYRFIVSDGVISDASFVRLKNVAISYSLPSNLLKKSHIENVRMYLQCQNLFTITSYQGLDPESQGLSLPPLRTITGGIQVTF
jgi:TonB-linked SusC/RagA family outer membrane protein